MKPQKYLIYTVGGDGVIGESPAYDIDHTRIIQCITNALHGIRGYDPWASAWWQGRLSVIVRDASGQIVWSWKRCDTPECRAAQRRLSLASR